MQGWVTMGYDPNYEPDDSDLVNHFSGPDDVSIVENDTRTIWKWERDHDGHNGTYLFEITPEQMDALKEGKAIVAGVSGHEYGVVIRLKR